MIVATIGNTIGSLIAYAIGAWGGRPFLERWGKYLLIRQHEIELAEHFFQQVRMPPLPSSAACCRSSARSSASQPGWPAWTCASSSSIRRPARSSGRPARPGRRASWVDTGPDDPPPARSHSTCSSPSWSSWSIGLFVWWRIGHARSGPVATRGPPGATDRADARRRLGAAVRVDARVRRCASTAARSRARSAGTPRTFDKVAAAELDTWRAAGLLHDFDYERYPEQHPLAGADRAAPPRLPGGAGPGGPGPRRSHRQCRAPQTWRMRCTRATR